MRVLDSGPSTSSKTGSMTWKCNYCGAENDETQRYCDGCGDKRPGTVAHSQVIGGSKPVQEPLEESLTPEDMSEEEKEEEELEIAEPEPAPEPSPPTTGQRYYLVFINTPARSLIKSRVAIEFEDFPVITIGRSPENVVVIPDQEVSRKHAQLTTDGTKLFLKDLKSSNGTFVYDGKEFQRVSDSVEVKPNTILKFGTSTIVRLISE